MSGFQDLKDLFSRRLLAAALRDEAGETTTSTYEEELHRQRKLLDVILAPEIKLRRADVQELSSPSVNGEDTKSSNIKQEQEPLSISQEGEQLQGLAEDETPMFPFNIVIVKKEEDEDKPQISNLYHAQATEDCGRTEPARKSDSERYLQKGTEVKTEDISETETEDSDDYTDLSDQSYLRYTGKTKQERTRKEKKSPKCSEYSKKVKKKHNLIRHKNIHTDRKTDGKNFSLENCSYQHIRIHTGQKRFSCSECGKKFEVKGSLNRHMLIHAGEKPLSCSECGKTFRDKNHLNRHMRIHTGDKPFSCSECDKTFIQKCNLKIHMRTHTGEKPFFCSDCGKTFSRVSCLYQHMRIHTGEKPFGCSECGKTFRLKALMNRHMRIHTGEKRFSCSECGKSFHANWHLTRHEDSHRRKTI